MPVTLHPSIRYRVIDRCLRRRDRRYTWEIFSEEIGKEFEALGLTTDKPSKRTIDYDIQRMKSGKLGYEAPIFFDKELGYYYESDDFSIQKIPLKKQTIKNLTQAIVLLKQITGNHRIATIQKSIEDLQEELRLESLETNESAIFFEKSSNEMGQFWISDLYDHVLKKQCLIIDYTPFDEAARDIFMSPYHLHEYNNRWYLIGWQHQENRIIQLGLDRINKITPSIQPFYLHDQFDFDHYKKHLFGITILQDTSSVDIIFKATRRQAFYLMTKPIHQSQSIISETHHHKIFKIHVFLNHEIKHHFLSFGDTVEVLEPEELRQSIEATVKSLSEIYSSD